jgi:ribosomal protein S18 acetylase RimI-like enzyme
MDDARAPDAAGTRALDAGPSTRGVRVRAARPDDFPTVLALFDALNRQHADALPDVARAPDPPNLTRAELAEMLASPNVLFAVAELDGDVVGFVDASRHQPSDPTDVDAPWCGINNLAVRADRRRRGVGTALVRAAEAWAGAKGLGDVRLQVYEFNAGARAFYERLGYATLARRMRKPIGA